MIVIGADTHKRSHTVAAVEAATGRSLGERTVSARRASFDSAATGEEALPLQGTSPTATTTSSSRSRMRRASGTRRRSSCRSTGARPAGESQRLSSAASDRRS